MTTITPDVIEKQKKLFCDWFANQYMVSIHFDGDKIVTPPVGGRSQGKSVSLCANVAWAAWQESRKSSVIELPDVTIVGKKRCVFEPDLIVTIESQGYQVNFSKPTQG